MLHKTLILGIGRIAHGIWPGDPKRPQNPQKATDPKNPDFEAPMTVREFPLFYGGKH